MRYIVNLQLILGEYEKSSVQSIEADSKDEAMRLALEGECHNECNMEPDGESCWDGIEFVYRVRSCIEVPDGLGKLFNRLDCGYNVDTDELKERATRHAALFYLCEELPDDFFADDFTYEESDGEGDADYHRDQFTEAHLWQPFECWTSEQIWKEIDGLADRFKAVALGELFEQ